MSITRENMIIYIDMDGVMCQLRLNDLKLAYKKARKENPGKPFPPPIPGFFENLKPIPGAIDTVNWLRAWADVYVLSAPSVRNPLSYTEKRLWIEKYFDLKFCYKLILCPNKGLLRGDFLIDDHKSGKGQDRFEGRLIHFGSSDFSTWQSVREYFQNLAPH